MNEIQQKIESLRTFLRDCDYRYYILDDPNVSDAEYDSKMKELKETNGTSIVIVTHDIGVVRAMADTVLVIKNGMCVEYGDATQVLEHPGKAYTKELLAAVPKLKVRRE